MSESKKDVVKLAETADKSPTLQKVVLNQEFSTNTTILFFSHLYKLFYNFKKNVISVCKSNIAFFRTTFLLKTQIKP